MRYQAYVRWLKWLTLALLAYVAVAFTVEVDWPALIRETALPGLALGHDALLMIVAVFGTTISPYLFFWQAALEMESGHDGRPRSGAGLRAGAAHPRGYPGWHDFLEPDWLFHHSRHRRHAARGRRRGYRTSAQAAEALRPLAGDFCFALFCLGIVGTGLLAVPVLAGSAAYAVAEAAGWPGSLDARLDKGEGAAFYAIIGAATMGGVALCFTPLDPVAELFWAAVCNGVIALPIMSVMMLLASRPKVMGAHVIGPCLRLAGWSATGVMALVVVAMLATL